MHFTTCTCSSYRNSIHCHQPTTLLFIVAIHEVEISTIVVSRVGMVCSLSRDPNWHDQFQPDTATCACTRMHNFFDLHMHRSKVCFPALEGNLVLPPYMLIRFDGFSAFTYLPGIMFTCKFGVNARKYFCLQCVKWLCLLVQMLHIARCSKHSVAVGYLGRLNITSSRRLFWPLVFALVIILSRSSPITPCHKKWH